MQSVRGAQIGRFILRSRIRRRIPRAELARRSLLSEEFIWRLENIEDTAICTTLMHAQQIAEALDCKFRPLEIGIPKFDENESLPRLASTERESLESLVDYTIRRNIRNEGRIFEMWHDYLEMRLHAIAGREDIDEPLSENDWATAFGSNGTLF
jgi:transcriptional regulator with XRE-family HTH domain